MIRPGVARRKPGGRPAHETTPLSVREVSLTEMRRAERKEADYPRDLFKATLDCSACPSMVVAGRLHAFEVRLRNDSPYDWPSPGLGSPEILLSYHWLHSTREAHRSLGVRTRLPLTLRPGDSFKVIADVLAPWQSGRYLLQWEPAHRECHLVFNSGLEGA